MTPRLLLADDSVTVQRVIELTFADEGMEVVAVGDGRLAIERLEREPPDIVLADVSMPERDGYEVAAHVKGTPHLSHIPVVLMTGAFEQIDEARAKAVGCDGVLAKPFEPHMVIALVRQLLRLPGAESGAAAEPAPPAAAEYPFEPGLGAPVPASGSLDDYLDRLDEALAAPAPAVSVAPAAPAIEPSEAPAEPAREAVPARSAPSLADAFAALLADELGEPAAASPWVGNTAAETDAGGRRAALSDVDLDVLARRVAERLSDRVVREVVADRVIEVAERLVREEIERIKAGA